MELLGTATSSSRLSTGPPPAPASTRASSISRSGTLPYRLPRNSSCRRTELARTLGSLRLAASLRHHAASSSGYAGAARVEARGKHVPRRGRARATHRAPPDRTRDACGSLLRTRATQWARRRARRVAHQSSKKSRARSPLQKAL